VLSKTEPKERKAKESKAEEIKEKENKTNLVLPFSDNFLFAWNRWKQFRKDQHKFTYKSQDSEQSALNRLANISGHSEETALKIIDQSIANGWQGLFEIKKDPEPQKPNYLAWMPAEG